MREHRTEWLVQVEADLVTFDKKTDIQVTADLIE